MPAIQAIFFDAGNTLLFPDLDVLLAPVRQRGVDATLAQWHDAEAYAKRHMDRVVIAAGAEVKPNGVDAQYWNDFFHHLLSQLHIADDAVHAESVRRARTSSNWNQLRPGTLESLTSLRERYKLGILSNSDGRIRNVLESVGLGNCFSSFTDSGIVGYEKPHPRIFEAALESMNVSAGVAAYVGDIYSVDYLGAKRVGMAPVLMDISRTYAAGPYTRVESIAEVAALCE